MQKNESTALENKCKAEWDTSPKLRAEFGEFSTYLAYVKAQEGGKLKILGGGKSNV